MVPSVSSQGTSSTDSPIDWQDCLSKANNKASLAKELLHILAKELPDFKRNISQAFTQNNMDELNRHIHKLHGACCYCGIPKLKQIINTLENHLHTLPPAALKTYIENLYHEIDQVIQILNDKSYL